MACTLVVTRRVAGQGLARIHEIHCNGTCTDIFFKKTKIKHEECVPKVGAAGESRESYRNKVWGGGSIGSGKPDEWKYRGGSVDTVRVVERRCVPDWREGKGERPRTRTWCRKC